MPKIYTAVYMDDNLKEFKQTFFLPDERSVRDAIRQNKGVPLCIREKKYKWWQREWVNKDYKIRFLRAIGFHTNAGLSPERALAIVVESESHTGKRVEIEPAFEVIKRGGCFSEAMEQIRMFDKSVIAILKSGEKGMHLKQAIKLAIDYMEEKKKMWKTFTGGLAFLSFDVFSAVSSVLGIQFVFIPWLKENGISAAAKQEEAQKFNDALNNLQLFNAAFLVITILFTLLSIIFIFCVFSKNENARKLIDAVSNRIPIVRSIVYDGLLADTFSIVGRMLKGHVQFDIATETAADSAPIHAVKKLWWEAKQRILFGDTIARAMDSPLLTKGEKIELNAHQNSQQLGDIFLSMSEERNYFHKRGIKAGIYISLMAVILYAAAVSLIGLKALMIQNEGVMGSFNSMGGF